MSDILIHIALQDGIKWSQKTHETASVNSCNFDLRLGNDVGGTWLTLEESALAKVVAGAVLLNLRGGSSSL